MRLNDAASSPSSSLDSTSTLAPRSPAATRRAASASDTTGRVTRAANHRLASTAIRIPAPPTSMAVETICLCNSISGRRELPTSRTPISCRFAPL